MDDEQAHDISVNFLKKKRGTNAVLRGSNFVTTCFAIKDKDFLMHLEDIPIFDCDKKKLSE